MVFVPASRLHLIGGGLDQHRGHVVESTSDVDAHGVAVSQDGQVLRSDAGRGHDSIEDRRIVLTASMNTIPERREIGVRGESLQEQEMLLMSNECEEGHVHHHPLPMRPLKNHGTVFSMSTSNTNPMKPRIRRPTPQMIAVCRNSLVWVSLPCG